jgi:SAM-dependent methyltransferase
VSAYVGLDLPGSRDTVRLPPDVHADAARQPFRDASFDTLLCVSTMNHLEHPGPALAEMRRVLRPGGAAILEFVQMAPLYEPTFDYRRFTALGARRLAEEAGFEVVEEIPFGGWPSYVGLVMLSALNRLNRGSKRVLTELPVRLLYVLIQSLAEALDRLVPNDREALSRLLVVRRREG